MSVLLVSSAPAAELKGNPQNGSIAQPVEQSLRSLTYFDCTAQEPIEPDHNSCDPASKTL